MKKIFTLMLALSALFASAQTLSDSTALVRLSLTRVEQTTKITVASKQTCAADYLVEYAGGSAVLRVAAGDSAHLSIPLDFSPVKVTPQSRCQGQGTIHSVTLAFTPQTLPIKFGRLQARWLSAGLAEIAFDADEVDTKVFRLQHSVDGRQWVTIPTNYAPAPAPDGLYRLQARISVGEVEGVHYVILNKSLALTNTVLLRKPIAGGVEQRFQTFFLRVQSVDAEGQSTYSPVVSLRTR